ncbi:MAG: pyruvate:ferredoxin (flavodoxin) oxidoreductase [Bacilli bacterium]|nr:pyruvate:ferredoxin (flavodoxin) oxidoreductase [Bacilli bacterium]
MVKNMKKDYIIDGNEACAKGAYLFSEVCGIYPITPASPMASLVDKWSSADKRNLFDDRVKVVEMQSEAGASALMHGSLQAGSLSTTFTASQGLLLMIPTMYKIAGEMLPGVIHVAARSLATHALSIFGDHQDVYATRSTGFCMLASSSVTDAYYMSIIAHLSAIESSLPFLHFFDGFRTSHELSKVSLLDEEEVKQLINYDKVNDFKKRALNIGKCITRGTSQTADVYFQNTEVRNKYYNEVPNIVDKLMKKLNKLSECDYKPFNYYGDKNATYVIVAMGSVCATIKTVVDILNKQGKHVGLIEVHLYRPFSKEYLTNVLPTTVNKIAVLDRTKESGSVGEPLYLDVVAALKDKNINIYGGRYGLSSKDVPLKDINAVFENLFSYDTKNNFTIGIDDDVTHLSLEPKEIDYEPDYREIKVYGFGSDGMVGASKNFMKVLGGIDTNYVQGYFEYDSKKSGGVTISHLRVGPSRINAPYFLTNPDFIVVSKDIYLNKYYCLKNIKENGILLISSNKNDEELNDLISNENKKEILDKNIKVYIASLDELNDKYSLKGKINNIMCLYMLKLNGYSTREIDEFKKLIAKTYESKGATIVENNINAIDEALKYLEEVDNRIFKLSKEETKNTDITEEILKLRGDKLKVSDFIDHKDGTFDGGTAASDKRKIASSVPKWIKENCTQCNQCSFVCPHACIRPFSITDNELLMAGIDKSETIESMGEENKNFYISVSEANCTGCGLCSSVCPGKNQEKALEMGPYSERHNKISEILYEHQENTTPFNKFTIKGIGFEKPYFEFSGACAGCGEAGYIKILTELYGKNMVIANATGCSSIYGGSLPLTPYKIPWMNSLFEDNAEFGFGIHMSYKNTRERIKKLMYKYKDTVSEEIKATFKEWIDNMEDDDLTLAIKNKLEKSNIPDEIRDLIDYIPSRKVWILGGDGWAYDIGYGGLDHVLHSNENINVMVLDTEVYSNTGGQKSKSTRVGGVAEFASSGKFESKKDLFRIAMSIPNVYVGSISMGANPMQTLKTLKEAYNHNGPSLIIAYSPCIEQGIFGGLTNSIDEQKMLVDVGYNLLMRYNPEEDKLTIDSKEPDFDSYDSVFRRELRYKNLEFKNEEEYQQLYEKNLHDAMNRYEYFKNLETKE